MSQTQKTVKEKGIEITQLVEIVKKAFYTAKKELPLEERDIHTKIINQVLNEFDKNAKVEFKYLTSKKRPISVVYSTLNVTIEEQVYKYQDLAITINGQITLIFRIYDLRLVRHNLFNVINNDWIYYGKVELVNYITQ